MSITRRTMLSGGLLAGAAALGIAGARRAMGGEAAMTTETLEAHDTDIASLWTVDASHVSPDPATVQGTVLTATPDPACEQRLFLWEEGNMPVSTPGAQERAGEDPAGYRPTLTSVPVPAGVEVKGAVLLCAGGAFVFRGDYGDCYPTAQRLALRGYQCFVVDYRVRPYSQAEGALDLARAIRFVRAHAAEYGLPHADAIAVAGYSAGGILCGEELLFWDGFTSPAELDPSYVPDSLDAVSADASADAMIYSFYGRLSVASKDVDTLRAGDLPPTYFCYGTRDPFVREFEANIACLREAGVEVRSLVLDGWPHGFGPFGGWIPEFDEFCQQAFAKAGE